MNAKKLITNLLLAFVLISIGFALGKEMTLRSVRASDAGGTPAMTSGADHLVVYYFHGTMRCVTCNTIEKMTQGVVHRDYAQQVEQKKIRWKVDNFQENEALAKKYDVATSTVVLSRIQGGKEVAFVRLDRVWELAHDQPRFQEFIRQSIDAMLKGGRP